MLKAEQSVFKITLNRGIIDGVLFKVEELKVSEVLGPSGGYVSLYDRKGKLAGRYMSSKFDRDLVIGGGFYSHSHVYFVTSLLELDEFLIKLFNSLKEKALTIKTSLESEMLSFNEDSEEYLISKGLDRGFLISSKEDIIRAAEENGVDYTYSLNMQFWSSDQSSMNSIVKVGCHHLQNNEDLRILAEEEEDAAEFYESFIDNLNKKMLIYYHLDKGEDNEYFYCDRLEIAVGNDLIYLNQHPFTPTSFKIDAYLPIDFNSESLFSKSDVEHLKSVIDKTLYEQIMIYTEYYNTLCNRAPNQLLDQIFFD